MRTARLAAIGSHVVVCLAPALTIVRHVEQGEASFEVRLILNKKD